MSTDAPEIVANLEPGPMPVVDTATAYDIQCKRDVALRKLARAKAAEAMARTQTDSPQRRAALVEAARTPPSAAQPGSTTTSTNWALGILVKHQPPASPAPAIVQRAASSAPFRPPRRIERAAATADTHQPVYTSPPPCRDGRRARSLAQTTPPTTTSKTGFQASALALAQQPLATAEPQQQEQQHRAAARYDVPSEDLYDYRAVRAQGESDVPVHDFDCPQIDPDVDVALSEVDEEDRLEARPACADANASSSVLPHVSPVVSSLPPVHSTLLPPSVHSATLFCSHQPAAPASAPKAPAASSAKPSAAASSSSKPKKPPPKKDSPEESKSGDEEEDEEMEEEDEKPKKKPAAAKKRKRQEEEEEEEDDEDEDDDDEEEVQESAAARKKRLDEETPAERKKRKARERKRKQRSTLKAALVARGPLSEAQGVMASVPAPFINNLIKCLQYDYFARGVIKRMIESYLPDEE
jgi:hypothetical protein